MEIDGKQVMIDYCHNVAGLEAVADFVRRYGAEKTIGVLTMPGDRRDEDIHAFGVLAGKTFDEVVIREDDDRRGRPHGQIAGVLEAAVAEAGMAPGKVTVILDEVQSGRAAVARADKNDLVVVFADKPAKMYAALTGGKEVGCGMSAHVFLAPSRTGGGARGSFVSTSAAAMVLSVTKFRIGSGGGLAAGSCDSHE
jgi:UDP-N-acetylmuramyl tripeptide synthase